MTDERASLAEAIAAQESLRGTVPDVVVDAAVAALTRQLESLELATGAKRRRLVTIVFADISGSTALGETMDPEDLSDLLDGIWARVDDVIVAYGGRIDKHMGDGILGLWGVDRAREDDVERAVLAALAMQRELRAAAADGLPIAMRIGINTGTVVIGGLASTGEITATGDAVNVAARLEQAAPVGGILVGHDAYRHVRGLFLVEARQPMQVRGRAQALRTYVVDGVRPRAFRTTRGIEGADTPMVGRAAELERLREALTAATDGRGTLVTVEGDAGLGKSRLLYELEDEVLLRPDVGLLSVRAQERHRSVPYALARDLLTEALGMAGPVPPGEPARRLADGLTALLGDDGRRAAPVVGSLLGLGPSEPPGAGDPDDVRGRRDQARQAVVEALAATGRDRPTVVLVDDLHWADPASVELLGQLAGCGGTGHILVVAASRPPLDPHLTPPGPAPMAHDRLVLAPLPEAASRELVRAALARAVTVPAGIEDRLVAMAAGNPYFVEELIGMLVDEGVVATDDERPAPDRGLDDLGVPPTLTGLLQARLDRLTAEERSLLQRAAVVGRTFWDGAVPPAGPADPARTAVVLAALTAKHVVRPVSPSSVTGAGEYLIAHDLLRQVAYEGLSKRDRRTHHRHVAEWLAARPDADLHATTVAEHFDLAAAPAEAARWHGRAADQARARFELDEAITRYRAALRPGLLDAATRVPLCEGLAEALLVQARYDESLEAGLAMQAAAGDAGDERGRAMALVLVSDAQGRLGRAREALASAQQAWALLAAATTASPADRMAVLTEMGWDLLRLGRLDEAQARGEEALALAPAGSESREQRQVLSLLGSVHIALGRFATAATYLERGLAIDRARGDRRGEAAALVNLGEVARLQGDDAAAVDLYEHALTVLRTTGDRDQEALALSNLGGALVGMGRCTEAADRLEEAVAGFTAAGGSEHLSETHRFLALARLGLDDLPGALDHAGRALALAERTGNPDHAGNAWRALGLAADRAGHAIEVAGHGPLDAGTCLDRSITVLDEAGMAADRARAQWDLARIEARRGRPERTTQLWHEARTTFAALGLPRLGERMDAERAGAEHADSGPSPGSGGG